MAGVSGGTKAKPAAKAKAAPPAPPSPPAVEATAEVAAAPAPTPPAEPPVAETTAAAPEAAVPEVAAPAPIGDDLVSQALAAIANGRGETLALEVVGPALGRRRAGREFGAEPRTFPLSELAATSIAAIEDDPQLMARLVPIGRDD